MRASGLFAGLLIVLTGCAVGPDYEPAGSDLPDEFLNTESVGSEDGAEIAGLWKSFGNDDLNQLLDAALANNTSISQSIAVLNETRALSGLSVYSLFPTVDTNATFERSTLSDRDPFAFPGLGTVERYRAGFDAAWEIDLFGSLRRAAESFNYSVEANEATVRAVQLAVVAEVAQTWFQWRGEKLRLDILNTNLANQGENLAILEAGLEAGRGTAFDVSRARAVERQIAATVPLAEAAIARALQRLAVLTRIPAEQLQAELDAPSEPQALPPLIAVGSPEQWLARRPDVRAAERALAAATADIGVATAEFYPKLNFIGGFGWTGLESSAIGAEDAERWQAAPTLSWRVLDFGRVRREVRAARARAAGAAAAFDEAWLIALEETENALATYRSTTERAARLEEARAEATDAARLARLRFDAGADSFLAVLDAERTRIELDDLLAQGRTDRATALAALYKALGGDFAMAAN